ncbi:bifunctional helix-turn-helix transcriptional regulator/GNAT family N-acetyltransferase [Parvularcula sp. ZS-1/3]|uniref:Bifunctional helix-turn-helix transcriptional regulator/GNAT family N-acetyltransferase n=1 Tax=Parvularcula mediterranea TaxID=2732508 RepID=A0A7Y3W6G5_9PROT|nr:bifunctional helix-turn-helix transcriptional regulator/GNAT family N-acetyltransferase [Parvularcula mediterranea]
MKDLGHLALASRLKRLAEALLADASKIHSESGEVLQPGQFPLIAALDRYGPMSVNDLADTLGVSQPATTRAASEAVKIGLVASGQAENDKRVRELSLTDEGRDCVDRLKRSMWPRVEAAARDLTQGLSGDILENVTEIERRLKDQSMLERVRGNTLRILHYTDDIAHHFHDINMEWLSAMFTIEQRDEDLLKRPRKNIIDKGGLIFFVQDGEAGIVGTCALERQADGFTELTKMGVRSSARRNGAGEFLLRFVLEHTRQLGWRDKLFLLSNERNTAALKLYEKLGFEQDGEIMERFGGRYDRCDVAMRFRE